MSWLTNSAVSEGSESKEEPDPQTNIEIECVDAVESDEVENCC